MKQTGDNGKAQRYGMVIDLDKCTGCGSCMVACQAENNVPFREDESDKTLSITWMRIYRLTNGKSRHPEKICRSSAGKSASR